MIKSASTMTTPSDLASALEKAKLGQFFAECTSAHRKEYLKWIDEAKRPETRTARIAKTIEMLGQKQAREIMRAKTKR